MIHSFSQRNVWLFLVDLEKLEEKSKYIRVTPNRKTKSNNKKKKNIDNIILESRGTLFSCSKFKYTNKFFETRHALEFGSKRDFDIIWCGCGYVCVCVYLCVAVCTEILNKPDETFYRFINFYYSKWHTVWIEKNETRKMTQYLQFGKWEVFVRAPVVVFVFSSFSHTACKQFENGGKIEKIYLKRNNGINGISLFMWSFPLI